MRGDELAVADFAGFADDARLHCRAHLDGIIRKAAFEGIDSLSAGPDELIQPNKRLIRRRVQCRNHNHTVTGQVRAGRLNEIAPDIHPV
ncbi:hypothetical protein D3C81_1815360 [compost metagenome]